MPTETVTLVLDKSQYERALADVVSGQGRLSRSGTQIGESFIRGDRAARVATANIVQGLATATTAADATLLTMQSLERVFRIPLGLTIFAAGAIALGEAIGRAIEKAQKLREEIERIKLASKLGADFLSSEQINKNLSDTSAKIKEIGDDIIQLRAGKGKIMGIDFMGSETRAGFIIEDEKKLAELRAASALSVLSLTSKQNDLNRIEMERLSGAEDQADLDKLEIDHKERLGQLADHIVAAGLAETEAARQLLSVENDRYKTAVATAKAKQEKSGSTVEAEKSAQGFFEDVGSGKFARDQQEKRQRAINEAEGRRQVAEFEAADESGIRLGPRARAVLNEARARAKEAKGSVRDLLNADFSNLLQLSKYDFKGLAPLSGLTIKLQ